MIAGFALCLLAVMPMQAHEGEDHGHSTAPAPATGVAWSTVFTVSKQFEVVLRYFPFDAGEETTMKLFISDFETNIPVDSATIEVTCLQAQDVSFEVHRIEPGIYELTATFPEKHPYDLALNIISR